VEKFILGICVIEEILAIYGLKIREVESELEMRYFCCIFANFENIVMSCFLLTIGVCVLLERLFQ